MFRRVIQRHRVLGYALVLLLGCKTPPPAAEAPAFVPFELLDPGQEPKALLRYKIAEGTTTTSTMTWKAIPEDEGAPTVTVSGLRSMEIKAVAGPAEIGEGEIRYKSEIVESKAVAGARASKKLVDDIKGHVDFLKGAGASVAIDDRGSVLGVRSNQKASEIPLRLLWVIENTTTLLSHVKLPKEAVGNGARWTVRGMTSFYGMKLLQAATYTLVEHTGDTIVLDIDFERFGERRALDFGDTEGLIEVESSESRATGRIELDLKTLGSNGTASGTLNEKVVIVEKGVRENREIRERYEIRLHSTTTVP